MPETLWFDTFTWLVLAMPFVGLLAAGLSKRENPVIRGDKVLRHDRPARVSHWTHAIGTAMLLVSGIILGSRFTPAFVDDASSAEWFNVHFLFVLPFLFGTFYWLGNTLISRYRFKEHLPTKHVIKYTIQHYGHLLGIKKYSMPPEEKYFESERAAFILALAASVVVVASGLVKTLAHQFFLPEGLMNVTTWVHDIAAASMLVFFVAHVFFGAIAPFSWKTFPSMITGYIPRKTAEEEHPGWIKELEEQGSVEPGEESSDEKSTVPVTGSMEGVEHV